MLEALAETVDVKKVATVAQTVFDKLVGFSIHLLIAVGLLVASYLLARFVARVIRMRCEAIKGFDQTLTPILAQSASYGIMIFALIMVLANFGIETTSIIAVLGAAGLAIGLALQGTLQNVAAGIMLLVIRPFRRGDYIEAGAAAGTVDETGLFMTRMRTVNGLFVAVPNSMILSNIITNYSRLPRRRFDLQVGISYDADIDVAQELILNLLNDDIRVLSEPPAIVVVRRLGDSSVDLELRAWASKEDFWSLNFDMTRAIKLALDEAGVSIPYPHRQLVLAPETVAKLAGDKPAPTVAKKTPKKRKKQATRPDNLEPAQEGDGE